MGETEDGAGAMEGASSRSTAPHSPPKGAGSPSTGVQLWGSIRPNQPCSFAAALSGLAVRPVEALSILCKHV